MTEKEYKQTPKYLKALEIANNFIKEKDQKVEGFTSYVGIQTSDKTYPVLWNFSIALQLQIIEKLNRLDKQIKLIESKISAKEKLQKESTQSEIDKVTNLLKDFRPYGETSRSKPIIYTYWDPKRYE